MAFRVKGGTIFVPALMDEGLRGIGNAHGYIDGILITSKTKDSHYHVV